MKPVVTQPHAWLTKYATEMKLGRNHKHIKADDKADVLAQLAAHA